MPHDYQLFAQLFPFEKNCRFGFLGFFPGGKKLKQIKAKVQST